MLSNAGDNSYSDHCQVWWVRDPLASGATPVNFVGSFENDDFRGVCHGCY